MNQDKIVFEKYAVYILCVENNLGEIDDYVGTIWDGEDFCPLKSIFIVHPSIDCLDKINNRVKILSIRKM